jgi:triacylglycerol lipase
MNIILVHGILGFRSRFGVPYFRNVASHLQEKGFNVFAPELNPTQGITFRGEQLRDQIQAALDSHDLDSTAETHIIAHSMGGLDSRYLLSPSNSRPLQFSIRSLTTISTPHRGSPIADLVDDPLELRPFPHLRFSSASHLLEPAIAAVGISLNGLRDLTTQSCLSFTRAYPDNSQVAYFSVAGTGRPAFPYTAAAFSLFHYYISALTGDSNDGLVTVSSAKWGSFDPAPWPGDHAEETGYNLDNLVVSPDFPYLAKYDQIIANVTAL